MLLNIEINFPEERFVLLCAETIAYKKQSIEKNLCEVIEQAIRESMKVLDSVLAISFQCTFIYDKCLSLHEYIENGNIVMWHISVDLDLKKLEPMDDLFLILPSYIALDSPGYAGPREKRQRVSVRKKKLLKTKTKYNFSLSPLCIYQDTLQKIYLSLPDDMQVLIPSRLPVWEWRQTFYNIKTGESFFCGCFKDAIEKHGYKNSPHEHPHITYALLNKAFRDKICHLCTKEHSELAFCHKMYGSFVKVKYGAYIQKTALELEIGEREAENIVRKAVGHPLIGECWKKETELYYLIKNAFPQIEVIHHGRPNFLKGQEYDIWLPEYKIAIEYQGIQHYKAIKHWGGEKGLAERKDLDRLKFEISKKNDINLMYVEENYDLQKLLGHIRTLIANSNITSQQITDHLSQP